MTRWAALPGLTLSGEHLQGSARRLRDILALTLVSLVLLTAVIGPLLAPHDPTQQHVLRQLEPASATFPLGTDELGRCLLSRLLTGARLSIFSGFITVAAAAGIGILAGLCAGWFRGVVDALIMRTVDALLAFPGLILAIVVVGTVGPSLPAALLALTVVHWTTYARVVRGVTLAVRQQPHVEAARAAGLPAWRILWRHVLPQTLPPVLILATFGVGQMILATAALSFLGLGAQPPTPEWGAMLSRGREYLRSAPHLMTWPGLAITFSVLAFNLAGDAFRSRFVLPADSSSVAR